VVGGGPAVGRTPKRGANSNAGDGSTAAPAASSDDGRDETDRSGAFRRQREDAPAPVPPSGEAPAAAPKPGAKPANRNRRKGPASKSSRKGGSKR
jgi:hypothetical protein